MPRAISIQATYKNGIKVCRGIYSPTNAEYIISLLSANELFKAMGMFIKATKGKKYKSLCIVHHISTGYVKDGSFQLTVHNPKLDLREAIRQIEINNIAYHAHL